MAVSNDGGYREISVEPTSHEISGRLRPRMEPSSHEPNLGPHGPGWSRPRRRFLRHVHELALQDSLSIQVESNTAESAPDPSGTPVVVVLLPQVPIGPYTTPQILVILIQNTQSAAVHTDTFESTPLRACLAMELVIEMIATQAVPALRAIIHSTPVHR